MIHSDSLAILSVVKIYLFSSYFPQEKMDIMYKYIVIDHWPPCNKTGVINDPFASSAV